MRYLLLVFCLGGCGQAVVTDDGEETPVGGTTGGGTTGGTVPVVYTTLLDGLYELHGDVELATCSACPRTWSDTWRIRTSGRIVEFTSGARRGIDKFEGGWCWKNNYSGDIDGCSVTVNEGACLEQLTATELSATYLKKVVGACGERPIDCQCGYWLVGEK